MNQDMIEQVAARLHLSAMKLLRQVRRQEGDGIAAARLSALSVIALTGPVSLSELAAAEHVRAPTMSRLVDALVRDGLVVRETDAVDRRSIRISASPDGRALLREGGRSRVGVLARRVQALGESEKRALLRGVELMEQITRN
jgi:DNA-binding MarR family transcriptional regulator